MAGLCPVIMCLLTSPVHAQRDTLVISRTPALEIDRVGGADARRLPDVRGARRTRDGGIVVVASSELIYFDASGVHLRTVGRDGYGSFQALIWAAVMASDSLLTFDMRRGLATILDAEGNPARAFQLAVHRDHDMAVPQGIFADGSILSIAGPPLEEPDSAGNGYWVYVALTVSTTDVRLSAFLYPVAQRRCPGPGCARTSSPHQALWAAGPDRLYYYRPDRLELAVFDMTGQPIATLSLNGLVPVPTSEAAPAVRALQVDGTGDLWIRVSDREWRVLDPSGTLQRLVHLPPELRVLDLGRDWVLGVVRDAEGIQRVRMHALVRATETVQMRIPDCQARASTYLQQVSSAVAPASARRE